MNATDTTSGEVTADARRPLPRWRGAAVSLLGLAMVAVAGPWAGVAAAEAPTTDGPTAAAYGSDWLIAQLDAGVPLSNFGSPDWGLTADAGLGLAAAGTGGTQLEELWTALVDNRETVVTDAAGDVPGRLARVILLGVALGRNVRDVGDAPGNDLVARLAATLQTEGVDAGLYGTQFALYDGAFRQGYSIAALAAAGEAPDPAGVQWLLDQQCADGSWMPYRSDLDAPCAFDGDQFVGPESNSTAAAVSGLVTAGAGSEAIAAAMDWFDAVQSPDGGWGFFPGDGSDPNSTALVMQALIADQAAADVRFLDQNGTPLSALLSFQLGCDALAADQGAFTFPGSNGAPNGLATAQGVAAAAGAPLVGDGSPAADVGPLDCEPEPSTTTTTAPTTTVAPTTVPTTVPVTTAVPTTTVPSSSVVSPQPSAQVLAATTTAAAPAATTLALTGADSRWLASLGVALILAGVLVAWRARGSQRSQ